jgi:16S rRNA (adenine1518-N6/adenine1519-N6)-dimethyltransferase
VVRAIPRTVFHPAPNVDSVLVGLRRRSAIAGAPNLSPGLQALVGGAFAHRRKTLAGSLTLSGRAEGRSREQIRAALERLGHPADVRAERLSPEDFRALVRLLEL